MRKRRRRKRKRRRRKRSLHLSFAPLRKLMRGGIYNLHPASYLCILQPSHASYSTIGERMRKRRRRKRKRRKRKKSGRNQI